MAINISSRSCELIIGSQDWSKWLSFERGGIVGYDEYEIGKGLKPATGTITLKYSQHDGTLPSNPLYRLNPNQWRRGQTISIRTINASGTLTYLPCSGQKLYLLRPPQRPAPSMNGQLELVLNVGCRLALENFPPEPNADVSGVVCGTDLNRANIIGNILDYIGASHSLSSMPLPINYPLPKVVGNYVEMCGQIADSVGYYLICDTDGTIINLPINSTYTSSSVANYTIGTDEKAWESIGDISMQALEKTVVTGLKQIVTAVSGVPQWKYNYLPLNQVLPNVTAYKDVVSPTLSSKISTTKTLVNSNYYTSEEITWQPIGAALPQTDIYAPVTVPTISKIVDITLMRDSPTSGQVVQITQTQQPIGAILPNTAINKNNAVLYHSDYEKKTYYLQLANDYNPNLYVVYKVITESKKSIGALLPDTVINIENASLVDSYYKEETWTKLYEGVWNLEVYEEKPAAVESPSSVANKENASLVQSLHTIDPLSTTAPPANPFDGISANTIQELQIDAIVYAQQLGSDANLRPRQRTIDVPYAISQAQLSQYGSRSNQIITGRSLGWQFGGAITDTTLSTNFRPFAQVAVTDVDNTIYYLKLDAIQYGLNGTEAWCVWHGIDVGTATVSNPTGVTPPVAIVIKPNPFNVVSDAFAVYDPISINIVDLNSDAIAVLPISVSINIVNLYSDAIAVI